MPLRNHSLNRQILPGISAGLVTGMINVIVTISLAALILTGDTSPYVPNGIGLLLLGGVPALLLVGFFSSYKGSIVVTQDAPGAILAVMAAGIIQSISSASPFEKFVTVTAVIVLTTLLTGISFILLGYFRLGSLVRFLPYPVIGGFLAGTGYLLLTGGIGVMADVPFNLSSLGPLFQATILPHWAPGLVLAVIMLAVLHRTKHFLILPGMLLGTIVLFYLIAALLQTPVATLSSQGWLLGPFATGRLWQPPMVSDWTLIHWDSILAQAGGIASVLMISVVSLLLNASGIELATRQDMDLNHELRITGLGNILGGLLGGSVSYHALTDTVINHRISHGSRVTSWVTAGVCVLPLFLGAASLSFIPKLTLGAVLILFGLSFLYEWIYQSWFKFSRLEYSVILLILISIATLGYLQGVGIGIMAAVGLFVVDYSRIKVARHALTGAELQSRFTRSPNQNKVLSEQGEKTYILQLQGFIFFGTANKLLEQVRSRIAQPNLAALQFVILDFSNVSGLNSTAMLSFSKMKQILQDRDITTLVTGPSAEILHQLERGEFVSASSAYPDLDHGLEWVENRLLQACGQLDEQILPLKEMLRKLLPAENHLDELFGYLEKREVNPGDYLIHQADAPDNIYFVESGQVTAQLEYPGQPPLRLETMKAGRVVGELGFYLGNARTAAVIADEPGTIYLLSTQNLAVMEKQSPQAASTFHQLIIQLLAERTTHLIRTVAALEK